MIMNVGKKPIITQKGLLSTVLYRFKGETVYGFEGAIECGA